ncbi:MAG: cytochrome c3 family protein [Thermodesulfobacteriota bacterium]|nr:cytochrome c3 family protein [Thermodesulfobacteriota bacterium]
MKKQLFVVVVIVLSAMFLYATVYATQKVADEILMNSKVYEKHKMGLVPFSHKKHNVDYKIACTNCHHVYKDDKNVWKEGQKVQKCDACHNKARAPKTKAGKPSLSKKEKIKVAHYQAIHENCKGCHKELKKADKPTGPTSCGKCHPK